MQIINMKTPHDPSRTLQLYILLHSIPKRAASTPNTPVYVYADGSQEMAAEELEDEEEPPLEVELPLEVSAVLEQIGFDLMTPWLASVPDGPHS